LLSKKLRPLGNLVNTAVISNPGAMTDDRRTMADLADLLGVKAATIRHYRAVSLPGGRYADHPFPEPSGHLGQTPYWLSERNDEIRAWAAARPGKGVGGGRPSHRVAEEGREA
jgi:hypothetical protein